MARIHPSTPISGPLGPGEYRERDVLRVLADGLPDSFDVFHNLPWSSMQGDRQTFGELDLVVVAANASILLMEVKAGSINEDAHGLSKTYGGHGDTKDIGYQVRRQHSALMSRIKDGDLPKVSVQTLLVLPDHEIHSSTLAYPDEHIVDSKAYGKLCLRVLSAFQHAQETSDDRDRVLDFFSNRFHVVPDVSTNISQVQHASALLASGLATWVPKISHQSNLFFIEATAGSGKTQLALKLLKDAVSNKQRCLYVCYNRPLADHLAQLAPAAVEVTTFHQLCRDHVERLGETIDFSATDAFEKITQAYVQASEQFTKRLDLLIIDESQDFDPAWAQAAIAQLKDSGRLYVMGDSGQQLYEREAFDLTDAVHVTCMDNFRSPQKVVHMINQLELTKEPVVSRSPHKGETPVIHTWAQGKLNHLTALNQCLKNLWLQGYHPEQVAVISFHGIKASEAFAQEELGGYKTKRFRGYDREGNALWSEGALLVDTVYRFKGQSMPVIVLCEIDFEIFSDKEKRKLFVGLTRGQVRVDVVMSERSALLLF